MELVDHLLAAQNGRLVALLGAAAGLDVADARDLLNRQVPFIARRIDALAGDDPVALETVFDIVEAGEAEEYLDDIRALTSRAAVRDGEELLVHLFGSLPAAREEARALGAPPGVDPGLAERFLTFAAVLTLAAMSRRLRSDLPPAGSARVSRILGEGRTADAPATAGRGVVESPPAETVSAAAGLVEQIFGGLVEGLVRGLARALLPRRRRRARYARRYRRNTRRRRYRRRRYRRRRRDRDLLRDILGAVLDR